MTPTPPLEILTIIPARGGSKRVKGKNLLPIGDTPLVTLAADTAEAANMSSDKFNLRIMVATDDDRIADVAEMSCLAYHRQPSADDETIGDMLKSVVEEVQWSGPVIVIQPTSVPDYRQLIEFIEFWVDDGADEYVVTVTPESGLYWGHDQTRLYGPRVNSQQLGPTVWKENGAVRAYPADTVDFNAHPDDIRTLYGVTDIDTWGDLQQVRSRHNRGEVVFSITATEKTGAGHLYRSMSIAQELQHHDVRFDAYDMEGWALDILKSRGWVVVTGGWPRKADNAVWVNDRLDTSIELVASKLRGGWKVVNIEDRGPGALKADLVINAMYPGSADHEVNGPEWAVIRPEFFLGNWSYSARGNNVLVLFGGTDPKDLTFQVADTLTSSDHVRAVVMTGPGYKGAYSGRLHEGSVAVAMRDCDLLITSGGRTVYEAAAIGIPTIVIAQNLRETTHQHLGTEHGNLYLGLADTVSPRRIIETVEGLLLFPEPRLEMSERSKGMVDGKGVRRIVRRIEDLLEGL